LLVVAFAALSPEEQDEGFARLGEIRVERLAQEEGETAHYLRALRRAQALSDGALTPDSYTRTQKALRAGGEELPPLSRLVRHFDSWARAKEAFALGEVTTVDKIEARFRSRVAGRPHFSAEELADALARCVAAVGRVPLLSEYDAWRDRELALLRLRGELARVPSTSSFRRRHGSWPRALAAHGFSTEEVYTRLEPRSGRTLARVDRYTEATLDTAFARCVRALDGGVPLVADYVAWRRSVERHAATLVPSDGPFRTRFGSWEKALVHYGFSAAAISARKSGGRRRGNANLESG
jgi:Homing endonuclease associated repeat